jgi:DNA-binding NtrC family response regulator
MSTRVVSVLVADDDLAVCDILTKMLSKGSYAVRVCQTVSEACRLLEETLFDVYLLDYNLPDGDGLQIAERVRSRGSEAGIIMISGYKVSEMALKAEESGVTEVVYKPFSETMILEAVARVLAVVAARREVAQKVVTADNLVDVGLIKKPRPKMAAVWFASLFLIICVLLVYWRVHGL